MASLQPVINEMPRAPQNAHRRVGFCGVSGMYRGVTVGTNALAGGNGVGITLAGGRGLGTTFAGLVSLTLGVLRRTDMLFLRGKSDTVLLSSNTVNNDWHEAVVDTAQFATLPVKCARTVNVKTYLV